MAYKALNGIIQAANTPWMPDYIVIEVKEPTMITRSDLMLLRNVVHGAPVKEGYLATRLATIDHNLNQGTTEDRRLPSKPREYYTQMAHRAVSDRARQLAKELNLDDIIATLSGLENGLYTDGDQDEDAERVGEAIALIQALKVDM